MYDQNPQKSYPKNNVYHYQLKPAFSTLTQQQTTSIDHNTHSQHQFPSSSNNQTWLYDKIRVEQSRKSELQFLHEKIQNLYGQLEQVMNLINEADEKDSSQNSQRVVSIEKKLEETLTQVQQLQEYLREMNEKLKKSEQLNEMLQNQLRMSQENNEELRRQFEKINEELESLKADISREGKKEQKENRQKQQIEVILKKFHNLTLDYNTIAEQKEELEGKIEELTAMKIQQEQKNTSLKQYKEKFQMSKDEIGYLKEEITKLSELSIYNQRQIIEKYQKEIHILKSAQSNISHEAYEQKIHELGNQISTLTRQNSQKQILVKNYHQQVRAVTIKLQQEATLYQERLKSIKQQYQSKIWSLQATINDLHENSQSEQQQKKALESQKQILMSELNQMKRTLEIIQSQVKRVVDVKESYAKEIKQLQQIINNLRESEQEGIRRINQLQGYSKQKKQEEKAQANKKIEIQKRRSEEMTEKEGRKRQLEQIIQKLEEQIEKMKLEKETERKKYRQLLSEYKQMNDEIKQEISRLRDKEKNSCENHIKSHSYNSYPNPAFDQFLENSKLDTMLIKQQNSRLKKELQNSKSVIRTLQKQLYDFKLTAFEGHFRNAPHKEEEVLTNRQFIDKLEKKHQGQIGAYKETVKALQNNIDSLNKQYSEWKHRIQMEYTNKLQVQRTEIISEYRLMLQNREIKDKEVMNYNSIPIERLKYHPEFKKLQQEIIELNKKLMDQQQSNYQKVTKLNDELNKLQIQNKYHRQNLDNFMKSHHHLHKNNQNNSFTINQPQRPSSSIYHPQEYFQNQALNFGTSINWRNQYDEVSREYKQLYRDYIRMKNELITRDAQNLNHQQVNEHISSWQYENSRILEHPANNLRGKKISKLLDSREDALSLNLSGKIKMSDREKDIHEHEASIQKSQRNEMIAKIKQELHQLNSD